MIMLRRFYFINDEEHNNYTGYSQSILFVGSDREIRSLHNSIQKKSVFYHQDFEYFPELVPGNIYGLYIDIYEDGLHGDYNIVGEQFLIRKLVEAMDEKKSWDPLY